MQEVLTEIAAYCDRSEPAGFAPTSPHTVTTSPAAAAAAAAAAARKRPRDDAARSATFNAAAQGEFAGPPRKRPRTGDPTPGEARGFVQLGHGELDARPSPYHEIVAIPEGTTLQFYADTGQTLGSSSDELDAWEQIRPPWPALDSTKVTYNLTFSGAVEHWPAFLRNNPRLGGHRLVRASVEGIPDEIRLCHDTRNECPITPDRSGQAGCTRATAFSARSTVTSTGWGARWSATWRTNGWWTPLWRTGRAGCSSAATRTRS